MGKYLHHYDSLSAFTADYDGETYLEPWVSYTEDEMPTKITGTIRLPNWDIPGELTLEYVGPCEFYMGLF
jgi:hypothetical protein